MTSHQFLSMDNASSLYKLPQKYDVLINFTGEEIHRKFVSHLNSALSTVGLSTYLHHHSGLKSTHIQEPILNLCQVAIIVFTETYSQSAWCLNQLQQIIKWHETYSRHVLPVYYEIQPSDVRLQKGDFGKAFKATAHQTFSGQELEHGMSRWSHALTKAANLFGWDESNYRSDAELVDKIVKSVLNLPVFSAVKFPVGLQSYVEDLIRTIKNKSTEVFILGLCGEGGSGKTTLAKAIYNQIHGTFTNKSFIEDIVQVSAMRGYLPLQEQLLFDILKTKVEVDNVEMGRSMIQERLSGKRVLIVLDDVPYFSALLDLWRCRQWFSGGTVIIITTRDKNLLRIYKVDSIFRLKLMKAKESLELLSWHAFREAKPKEEYKHLVESVVTYCEGLPLALEVIGSSLFERTEEEWYNVLFELEKSSQQPVIQKLKIGFDGLRNQMEKDIFLDVCRFFVGKGRAYATKILNGCGVEANNGIKVLIERSLLKVKNNNKFGMHPLLQEMGTRIICEISRKEPQRNNGLCLDEDPEYVLIDNTGTKAFHAIPKKLRSARREQSRLFKFPRNSLYDSKKLSWISLHGFSSKYLLDYFYDEAIAIELKHSDLRLAWKQPQVLRLLKVLNLSHSKYLKETPDFSGLPRLEQLILKDCPRLSQVHKSIGCLCNLLLLNLKDCTSLSNLPKGIYKLKSLRTLILSGCSNIDLMEKDTAQMKSLITLIAENAAVRQVPFSIVSSKSIGYISLLGFERLPHNLFSSIIRSWISPTMNPISYIHSLRMDMDNSWDDIAPLLSTLAKLRSVLVQCGAEYQLSKEMKVILLEYFANITESGTSKQHFSSSFIGVGAYHEFFKSVSDNISEVLASIESSDISFPTINGAHWLAHIGERHSVSFAVPRDRDMKGMVLCVIYLSTPKIIEPQFSTVLIVNYTKLTFQIHNHASVISFDDEDWHCIMSNLGSGDEVEIFVSLGDGLVIKNTVVYLISGESHDFGKESEPKKDSLNRFIKKIVK